MTISRTELGTTLADFVKWPVSQLEHHDIVMCEIGKLHVKCVPFVRNEKTLVVDRRSLHVG